MSKNFWFGIKSVGFVNETFQHVDFKLRQKQLWEAK